MAGPAVLEFTTESDLFGNVSSTATLAWYFGYDGALDSDLIVLSLCNAGLEEYSAMPYGEGELLRLYLYTEKSEVGDGPDLQNVVLAPGTYTLKEEAEGAFDLLGGDYGSIYAISTEEGWMGIGYESGTVTVSLEDGVLKMSGVFTTDKGHEITVSYEGPENLTDMTGGMSTSSMTVKPAPKPAEKAAVSGWRAL